MKNYVFVQVEASDFTTMEGEDQLTKIDAIKVDKNFKQIDQFSTYIKLRSKHLEITEEIKEITGITNELLEKYGIDEKEALEEFLKFINDSILIMHNGKFEMTSIIKGIYNNNVKDHEIYYFDLLRDLKTLGVKKKSLKSLRERYQIKEEDDLLATMAITKQILEEYKYSDLEEYNTKNKNRIRFPGLISKNVRAWVRFTQGDTNDNRRLIEFIDESKDGKLSYIINYRSINMEMTTFVELIKYREMGAKVIDSIFYFDPSISSYIDYYKINSNIKIEKEDTFLIERLEKAATDYLKDKKVKVICYGSIDTLKENYGIIDKKVLDKIISFIVAEI